MTLCFVAVAGLVSRASAAGTKQAHPNSLFIVVDNLNDWVNCIGGREGVHTPNIDHLAKRGLLFSNAHCAAPSCNSSRVAMMTGVALSSSGIYHNGQQWHESPRLAQAVTLPEHFLNGGYTVCIEVFSQLYRVICFRIVSHAGGRISGFDSLATLSEG